jgi:bifunctional enzyme CysN/CysC
MVNKGVQYDNIYCRFVIHAMPVAEEIDLIRISFDLLKEGGCIFIECRSINDPLSRKGEVLSPTERLHGHYRRFIIPYELDNRLVEEGFEVLEITEHSGVSRYNDDNPVVVRVTAIKN